MELLMVIVQLREPDQHAETRPMILHLERGDALPEHRVEAVGAAAGTMVQQKLAGILDGGAARGAAPSGGAAGPDDPTRHALLLPDPTMGPKMEEHAGRLVTGLLPLCAYRPAADVRRATLHCLSLFVKNVEYHHLHPLSAQLVSRHRHRHLVSAPSKGP
eukprot:jgi/Tetstr1/445718/TSEL_033366.t1